MCSANKITACRAAHLERSPMNLQCSWFRLPSFSQTILTLLMILASALAHAATPTHDDAVILARSGNYSDAIALLEVLHQQQPLNKKITNDLIVTYSWNRQYKQACTLFEKRTFENYPTYVQIAAGRAYRQLKQPDQALSLINLLLEKQPDNLDFLMYRGLLLVDKRQLQPARKILERLVQTTGKNRRYYRLSGYIHAAEENWTAALADYQKLIDLIPDDRPGIRQQFSALQYARAQQAAAIFLNEHEQFFTTDEHAQILLNQAAEKLRWSTDAAGDFNETRLLAMQALGLQIKALDLLGTGPNKDNWPTPVLNDLIVTLRNLRRMEDATVVYQQLSERGESPNYVKQAAAGAMLANRHPDKSRALYQQVLADEPANYQAQIGLFYSLVEEEDLDNAYDLINDLRKNEPTFQTTKNSKSPSYNDRYLDLNVSAIMARYYSDQLDDAWQGIDELVRNAPANNWLLEVRGQISNSREWYRQALYDFHYSSLLAPDSLNAKAGEASSLILLEQYRRARPLLESIQQQYPDEHQTRQLEKEWKFSRKPEYWADVTYGNSSGPELDGDGMLASAEILSNPINDNLYIDALYRYAWNEIIEGEETFNRYSMGLDYRLMDWNLMGRITYNDSGLDEVGGSVRATWTPDDFWRLTLAGELFSVDTPLRALFHGIRSDSLSAGLNYRWSEQRDLFAGVQGSSFTDNNDRIAGTAVFRQHLMDLPRFDLDGRIEAYGSASSRRDAPYYNPEQDFSLVGALHIDHVYFRSYDDSLTQMIDAGYGLYDQKGFGSRWIGHLRYEQRYTIDPRVEMLAGFEFGQNVYDGHAEPYRLVRFMINGKF